VRFKALCRSLTKLPGVTTPGALLQASVRVALTKARQAKRRVDAYAASYHGGNPVASMLDTCSTAYGGVADSLAEAQRLIDGGHATGADLNRELSAATTDALGCSDAFDERPEVPSPFPGTLRNVYRVVDDVLDIAYVVKPV
jgi:pectinesterase inhibitor-like protein